MKKLHITRGGVITQTHDVTDVQEAQAKFNEAYDSASDEIERASLGWFCTGDDDTVEAGRVTSATGAAAEAEAEASKPKKKAAPRKAAAKPAAKKAAAKKSKS